ncbi:MAG TPA: hypothetical protein DEV93_17800 [Chloroflexi bacterium]|jgi:hypothetical protein|nr:hypothetical protein [Chloroflexota bacterium]
MKRLIALIAVSGTLGLALVTGAHASPAHQTTTPTPVPGPPIQGNKVNLLLYVDTVTGPIGGVSSVCAQQNLFKHGQMVVFRMWGNNVKAAGAALTAKNVKSAVVNIPGLNPITLKYTSHSGNGLPKAVSYWEAPWAIPATYPIGVVDFTVVVKTKANKKAHLKSYTGSFSQQYLSPSSRLSVTP